MFVVDREGGATVLRGGGWGHGAGMCQWGAVGRAEAGQAYREILRAYFSGAEVARAFQPGRSGKSAAARRGRSST